MMQMISDVLLLLYFETILANDHTSDANNVCLCVQERSKNKDNVSKITKDKKYVTLENVNPEYNSGIKNDKGIFCNNTNDEKKENQNRCVVNSKDKNLLSEIPSNTSGTRNYRFLLTQRDVNSIMQRNGKACTSKNCNVDVWEFIYDYYNGDFIP